MSGRHRAEQVGYKVSPAELADMLEVAASVLRSDSKGSFDFPHRDLESHVELSYNQIPTIGFAPNPD